MYLGPILNTNTFQNIYNVVKTWRKEKKESLHTNEFITFDFWLYLIYHYISESDWIVDS